MTDLIVSFVLGGIAWEYRTQIKTFATKVYNDLTTEDDAPKANVKPQPAKKDPKSTPII